METIFKNVFLVDDDTTQNYLNVYLIKRMFKPHAIPLLCFHNPEDGVEFLAKSFALEPVPSLLLLDIRMPVLNGWEFLERIKSLDENVLNCLTIYLLSSSIDPKDLKRAGDHPLVTGFLSKPINPHMNSLLGSTLQALKAHSTS